MPKADDILKLMENGKWHGLKEIGKRTQLQDLDIVSVAKFLAQYNFIRLDEERQKVKLDPSTRRFLKKIQQLEVEEKL